MDGLRGVQGDGGLPVMALLPIPSDKAAWHALRAKHIGASEVAALFNMQAAFQPGIFALWMDRAGRVPLPPVEIERAQWGLRLEDAIAAGAAEAQGWEIQPGRYASHESGVGATLDRNGLRPARYIVTDDDLVVMASESGVLPIPENRIVRKWRLQPGKMFLIDFEQGRIVDDEELKNQFASAKPLKGGQVVLGLAETDPATRADRIIIADTDDGEPLSPQAGPFMVVAEGDVRAARSARMAVSIRVIPLGEPQA